MWERNIGHHRLNFGDGKSHLMSFQVDEVAMGENGGELKKAEPRPVHVRVQAGAWLPQETDGRIKGRS